MDKYGHFLGYNIQITPIFINIAVLSLNYGTISEYRASRSHVGRVHQNSAKIRYLAHNNYQELVKTNNEWEQIIKEFQKKMLVLEDIDAKVYQKLLPIGSKLPDSGNISEDKKNKKVFFDTLNTCISEITDIIDNEIDFLQNQRNGLHFNKRNLINEQKGILTTWKKSNKKQKTGTGNLFKIKEVLYDIFNSEHFKLLRAYFTGRLQIKDDKGEVIEDLGSVKCKIEPIRAKIMLSSNLLKKIYNGANIGGIQILTPKYPSRNCIANVNLKGPINVHYPRPAFLDNLDQPKKNSDEKLPDHVVQVNNARNILSKIKNHLKKEFRSNTMYAGLDDNRLNSLYTFAFSFITEENLKKISDETITEADAALQTLDTMIMVSDIPAQSANPSATKTVPQPITITTKEMEQIILACAGIRNLNDIEKEKYFLKRKDRDLSESPFHPLFDKIQEYVLSDLVIPKADDPDNPNDKKNPQFSDYLMAYVKYQAEKRNHLRQHITGLQRLNKPQLRELKEKNKLPNATPSYKLNLSSPAERRIFRRKTDKHHYYDRITNIRDSIGRYLLNVTALVIHIIEPKVIAHERLNFKEGGQRGFLALITQGMFKDFKEFSDIIKHWFHKEEIEETEGGNGGDSQGKKAKPSSYQPKFEGVPAQYTSYYSFTYRNILRLPAEFCEVDRSSNADYSYLIRPPDDKLQVRGEIVCSHEESAANILYRAYKNKPPPNKNPKSEPEPEPAGGSPVAYLKTGEG